MNNEDPAPITKQYYHYRFRETDLGYEVFNMKNGAIYLVTVTEQNGMVCTCPAMILGNTKMCKHKKYVMKLFYDLKK